ncbi:hypothetical protein AAVH_14901 [Aphelenchoides avenae]|nr:hypothetical protein AAVH_14901 [Aphelenchus avenae]
MAPAKAKPPVVTVTIVDQLIPPETSAPRLTREEERQKRQALVQSALEEAQFREKADAMEKLASIAQAREEAQKLQTQLTQSLLQEEQQMATITATQQAAITPPVAAPSPESHTPIPSLQEADQLIPISPASSPGTDAPVLNGPGAEAPVLSDGELDEGPEDPMDESGLPDYSTETAPTTVEQLQTETTAGPAPATEGQPMATETPAEPAPATVQQRQPEGLAASTPTAEEPPPAEDVPAETASPTAQQSPTEDAPPALHNATVPSEESISIRHSVRELSPEWREEFTGMFQPLATPAATPFNLQL